MDTNIFISALFWRGAPYEVLRDGLDGQFTLLTSAEILRELEDRLKNKFRFPDSDTNEFLEIIAINSYIVESGARREAVKADPTDNKIIECAVSGRAHFIISGDHHLLDLQEYDGIEIINARKFLSQL